MNLGSEESPLKKFAYEDFLSYTPKAGPAKERGFRGMADVKTKAKQKKMYKKGLYLY